MKKTFRNIVMVLPAIISLALSVPVQAAWTTTTLSAAVTSAGASDIIVANATNIAAPSNPVAYNPGTPSGSGITVLYVDREAMRVNAVNGTYIKVSRGYMGTKATAHASGATVYVGPAPYFLLSEPAGSCTLTALPVQPSIVPSTGNFFYCVDSVWKLGNREYTGTAGTGFTAIEEGYGRYHVTRLTFSGLTLGSPAGAADLAFGKLAYTLPAGAVVVKEASMSVALTNTGGVVTADTPDTGIGTTVGSGANAVLSAVGAAAENILTGQTSNDVNGTAEVKTVSDQILPIEAAGDHTVYLNVADGWAGADTVKGSGTIVLVWELLK
ncbi:MAG: hypothetical protein M1541_04960 [Acidobacteria bacterium]|nr:hypothetical protein [Acidobacteriota bacterium]